MEFVLVEVGTLWNPKSVLAAIQAAPAPIDPGKNKKGPRRYCPRTVHFESRGLGVEHNRK